METSMQPMKENTVFVGNKPVMNYVLAVVTQFNNGAGEVSIKARGKAISRAVDTAEIALNRFLDGISKKEIITSTEVIDTDTGKTNVSSIEIILSAKK
ncbi:DNA-binding protein Alba [Methanoregula boonei 6A8]|jgi:DNA-binding protein|uniref:DNA/RNA-binding protein Alba n=2 Tax=Methanoregula TaxID=395331 RepID=A7I857_METB6|nr:DNA-binding protein Alba [Methanoregula boonei 6A8]